MSDDTRPEGVTAGDDTSGLLQPALVTRAMRDAVETELISRSYDKYVYGRRRRSSDGKWLTESLIREIHMSMFGEMWEWAGKFRTVPLNIGIDPSQISEQVRVLCGDFIYWNTPAANMSEMEVGARLQHRLTKIHPFFNGNGRHARLITDIYFKSKGSRLPEWPQIQLLAHGDEVRGEYVAAMKCADQENFKPLIDFIAECLGEEN